jgi:hypothetical protein
MSLRIKHVPAYVVYVDGHSNITVFYMYLNGVKLTNNEAIEDFYAEDEEAETA